MNTAIDPAWARNAFDNPSALIAQNRAAASPRTPARVTPAPTGNSAPRGPETSLKTERRYSLHTTEAMASRPPARYRVKGVFMREAVASIFGPSGAAKSFLAMDMVYAISDDRDFFGGSVATCDVVWICQEGADGLERRVKAIRKKYGADSGDRIQYIMEPFSLLYADDVNALIASIKAAGIGNGVVVVDTLNAATPGMDENSSKDMGIAIAAVKRIRDECGGLVILIHHSGKDASKGLRGHSSLHAAMDTVIEVTREGDRRSWKLAKSKDGADGEEHQFRLQVIEIGIDEDGEPVSSCVIVPEESASNAMRRTLPPKSGNQRIIWDAIGELLRDSKSFGKAGAPASRPCVEIETAVDLLRTRLACEPKRQTERARSAISGLVERGLLILREGWLWAA
jgi:hypothetical protein